MEEAVAVFGLTPMTETHMEHNEKHNGSADRDAFDKDRTAQGLRARRVRHKETISVPFCRTSAGINPADRTQRVVRRRTEEQNNR